MNIATFLAAAARTGPERPAVSQGRRLLWTYREFYRRTASLAAGLVARHGLTPGDRVALLLPNCPEYLEVLHACWHAGLCVVPLNARLHADEARYTIAHSEARVCFSSNGCLETARTALRGAEVDLIEVAGAEYEALLSHSPVPIHQVNENETCWIFYTSGTTGRPKGAMLSHRCVTEMIWRHYADLDALDPSDCVIHTAALSHGCGLFSLPYTARGAHHLLPESKSFSEVAIFDLVARHRNVSFFAAPTMLRRLMNHPGLAAVPRDHIRSIFMGSAPSAPEDIARALEIFGPRLHHVYGQGEMPVTIACVGKKHFADPQRNKDRLLSSVGPARTGVELAIADPETGARLGPGEVGEVIARSPVVMQGYWRDAEATTAAIRNGWLHTGDLGSLDSEGWLTLNGRSKDMIISGGYNVYASEVELVLSQHPAVAQAAVIGAPHADWGEEVVAFVAREPNVTEASTDSLDAWCQERIARFKRPRRYAFVDALPVNSTGKIVKAPLRSALAQTHFETPAGNKTVGS